MWIGNKIDNLIELLGVNKYSKMELETNDDVAISITIENPKFRYNANATHIKYGTSK